MKSSSTLSDKAKPQAGPEDRAYAFLQDRRSGVLSTVDVVAGRPHASVIYYSVAPDRTIRFLTKENTRKAWNLSDGGPVMFVVYDEHEQAVVQISGTAIQVEGAAETHRQFMRTLRASLATSDSAVPPVAKIEAGDYVEYAITPEEIRFAEYKRRRLDSFKLT